MTAYEWCEVLAIGAFVVTAVTWLNRGPNADDDADRQQWHDSAAEAAREPITPLTDPAVAAEIDLLYAMCPDVTRVVQFPTQTRRTEEDQ